MPTLPLESADRLLMQAVLLSAAQDS